MNLDPITLATAYFEEVQFETTIVKELAIQAWAAGFKYAINHHATPQVTTQDTPQDDFAHIP